MTLIRREPSQPHAVPEQSAQPAVCVLLTAGGDESATALEQYLVAANASPFQVGRAATLEDALALIQAADYDLVLLELPLVGHKRLDAIAALCALDPQPAVIVLSNDTDEELAVQAVRAGAQDYLLTSELSARALVRAIHAALERHDRERKLRESEKGYRMLVEEASEAIIIFGGLGYNAIANHCACEMLGYSPEEIANLTLADVVEASDLAEKPPRYDAVLRGERLTIERMLVRKDGTMFPIEATTTLLKDGRIECIVRDITERKRTEEALRQSEEQFRNAFTYAATGLSLLSLDGSICRSMRPSPG